jgi:hypothetical protein
MRNRIVVYSFHIKQMFLKRNKLITIWGKKKKTSPVIFPYNMELSKVLIDSCKEARPRLTLD